MGGRGQCINIPVGLIHIKLNAKEGKYCIVLILMDAGDDANENIELQLNGIKGELLIKFFQTYHQISRIGEFLFKLSNEFLVQ